MRCPYCKEAGKDKVIDSRLTEGGNVVRRRRRCLNCNRRFTTKERLEEDVKLTVIKKDGSRVPFDRNKVLAGLQRACYKRPVPDETLRKLVESVEDAIFAKFDREVTSKFIGAQTVRRLRELDKVAYIRFASVYHDFQELGEFVDEVQEVMERSAADTPGQPTLFE